MSRIKTVRLIGLTDEVKKSGAIFLNGQLLPLETPIEMDEVTIDHIQEMRNYSRIDYSRMTTYQILQKLEENDPDGYYTLDDAEAIKKKAVEGQPDVRLSPLSWDRQVAVERL